LRIAIEWVDFKIVDRSRWNDESINKTINKSEFEMRQKRIIEIRLLINDESKELTISSRYSYNGCSCLLLQIAERKVLPRAEPGEHVTHENPVYSELLLQEEEQIHEMYDVKEETPPAEQSDLHASYIDAATAEEGAGHTY
jgi:hypothetical protein